MHFIAFERLDISQVDLENVLLVLVSFEIDPSFVYLHTFVTKIYFTFLKSLESQRVFGVKNKSSFRFAGIRERQSTR